MRISDAPKLKDMNMKYYGGGGVTLSDGILNWFQYMYGQEVEWLDSSTVFNSNFDKLMKIKYGDRHLNSWGQMMMREHDQSVADQQGFVDGCSLLWSLHQEEWKKLWNSYIAEYNPIWNVDGTETTVETRDLEDNHTGTDVLGQSGTIKLGRTGNNSDEHSGYDNLEHEGYNSDTTTGAYSDSRSGYDKVEHDGTDTFAKAGSETNTHNGNIKDTGTETVEKSIYGFNSSQDSPADKEVRTPDLMRKFDNETNELSYTNREDTETVDLDDTTNYNSSTTRQYDSNNPLTERHDLNSNDKQNYNSTTTHNFASTDTQTFDKTDTQTKKLTDTQDGTITTEHTRSGNIGVTMTQQMLQADKDYWLSATSLFFENVIKDIVNDLCYKIQVDEYI